MRFVLACLIAASLSLHWSLQPQRLAAQEADSRTKTAVINAADADGDFTYQGEYDGWLNAPGRGFAYMGLQVVALGEGEFNAILLTGGLPGAGWNQGLPEKLSGSLQGSELILSSAQHRIHVGAEMASVRDAADREVGRIGKHHRTSPTMGAAPPPGAKVLFPLGQVSNLSHPSEGQNENLSYLTGAKLAPDGTLLAGVLTTMPVEAFHMHLEFRTPYMPFARGQGRGNSGVYIQQRYEVQILDSFGLEGLDNECGGLYKQTRPDLNMCLPPLAWQTYDIWFTPPRFAPDRTTKVADAVITVLHNGVPIHWNRSISAKTGGGKVEGPEPFPINLQDHGNPVTFRNIWLVSHDMRETSAPAHCGSAGRWKCRSVGRRRALGR